MPGRNGKRFLSNFWIGAIAMVLVVIGFYLAFTKSIPFVTGGGYELKAVFQDAQLVRAKSPVRVNGVNVGQVTDVKHVTDENGDGQDASIVTMNIQDKALPIHSDATLALRPRLFLEGNLFVELTPGSPSAPDLKSGSIIPEDQTAYSVQLDQVLTSLQTPVRQNLQIFLKEFGDALEKYGGAEGFREAFRTSGNAFKYTSQVNQALLGEQPGDLAGFVSNLDTVVEALDANQSSLQSLITNFNSVAGSFAADQTSLRTAIVELPKVLAVGRPTLARLNADFPVLRAFARESLPGVKAANKALKYANPWMGQLRQLISKSELRGLVTDLDPTVPDLAQLSAQTVPFLEQGRALASCFNNVVIPWSNTKIPNNDTDPPAQKVYQETAYGFSGVAGESRSGDANGQEFRVLGGGGAASLSLAGPFNSPELSQQTFAPVDPTLFLSGTAAAAAEPAKTSSAKTPFRPDVPCETQDPPNLNAAVATIPPFP